MGCQFLSQFYTRADEKIRVSGRQRSTETARPNGAKSHASAPNDHKAHKPISNGHAPDGAPLINSNGILYQTADGAPRRSWRTWLIGRHLATADAAEQTIGKAIGLAVF